MMIRTRGERQASKVFQYDARGKKPWTVEEDNLLKEITDKHGTGNWTFIAQHFTERSGKQCRERWHNHLNPIIKKGDWTPEEDEIIVTMQRQWGNQWAKITTLLPGRTDNAVKNRFHATLRATKGKKGIKTNTSGMGSEIDMDMEMDMDDEMEEELKEDTSPLYTSGYYENSNAVADEELEVPDESSRFNSIGSIDMSTWKPSGIDIDINGIRDWMVDDMDCDMSESDSFPQPVHSTVAPVQPKPQTQLPKPSWLSGGFTTTMCSGNDYESNDQRQAAQAQQKQSPMAFCSMSYSYLQSRF